MFSHTPRQHSGTTKSDNKARHVDSNSYTAAVAHEASRLEARTVPGLLTTSPVVDTAQGLASAVTFAIGTSLLISILLVAAPLLAVLSTKNRPHSATDVPPDNDDDGGDGGNRSVTGGSRTAIVALWSRAQMRRLGPGPDDLAPPLMDRLSIPGSEDPTSVLISRCCGWLTRTNFRLTGGRVFEDQLAGAAPFARTGPVALLQARTCWLDDCVEEFVRRLPGPGGRTGVDVDGEREGVEGARAPSLGNVVILGAGFDTRCYRLDRLLSSDDARAAAVRTYEVDAPGTQSQKRRIMSKCGVDAGGTNFVPCDFEKESWYRCLRDSGDFDATLPTLFVWEGVTMFLSEDTVRDTLLQVSKFCPKGSCIGFDYLDGSWASAPWITKLTAAVGEPFRFTPTESEVEQLLDLCSLSCLDHLRRGELVERYLPTHWDGRPMGLLDENFGGFVLAGVD